MKIVFFGTPDYVLPILETLHKKFKEKPGESPIVAVVTQKPKPVGRKKILEYSVIDKWAHKRNLPIFYKSEDLIEKHIIADIGVLAAYGKILSKKIINYFPHGILNIHPSLLPKYRGASPVQAAIVSGDKKTGITFIKLDEKMDHGKIISQYKEQIQGEDTTESLRKKLFEKSAEILVGLLPVYAEGKIKLSEQDHNKASFTRQITKQDAFIPPKYLSTTFKGTSFKGRWKIPFINFIKNYSLVPNVYSLERFIRAMQPWPQAWTYVQLNSRLKTKNSKRLKILKAHVKKTQNTKHKTQKEKNSYLVLDIVQLEGKNPVTWQQFIQGYPEAKFT